jgi:microcystin degradation protein MlrC
VNQPLDAPRIAIAGVLTECNHFGGVPIDMDWFRTNEFFLGDELLSITTSVVGGILDALANSGAEAAPLIYASACPGGVITAECFRLLKNELLDRLRAEIPVDGLLMPLHGAALVEELDDPEGDLIKAAREIVGPETPIVVTLDLHAHVTEKMVEHADAILAWETYPHRDQFSTGQRAATLITDIINGKCEPTMAMAKVPVLTSAIHGSTENDDPFADLMKLTKSQEKLSGVLSTSLFLIHPYMDAADMGSGALVVTDNNLSQAKTLATDIALKYWDRRHNLEPTTFTPFDAIQQGMAISGGPVLLVETADCCGGGAAGDSIATLSALVDCGEDVSAIVPLVDPQAAAICQAAGVGAEIEIELGHHLDARWGTPRTFSGRVEQLSSGQFTYSGGQWEGLQAEMGPSAVFSIGSIQVLITSRATYDWADEQFQSVGLDARSAKFVVAKNPMNYQLAYGAFLKGVFILDTPGPTPATMRHTKFDKLQRPYFPADDDISNLLPRVLT